MSKKFETALTEAFSILPEDRVDSAVKSTLERLRQTESGGPAVLRWANFDQKGHFLRGGITNMGDNLTRLVARPGDDPAIAMLATDAADGAAQPGRVLCAPDRESFALFLPASDSTQDALPVQIVRGFIIDADVFAAVLTQFSAGSRLTQAERRVTFQIVAGLSLRDAAAFDKVGVETKRAQIKSVTAKLQCAGQLDLVRTVIGQLSYVLALADNEAAYSRFTEDFVARYLADDVTLTVERLPNGRIVRCLEAGPEDGRVLLVIHGMMFGMLLSGAGPWLAQHGIRLVMPLRHGYLDPRPVVEIRKTRRLVRESLDDIALLVQQRRLAPVTLLGHSLGATVALRFLTSFPDLVDRLALVSANFLRDDVGEEDHTRKLYGGYRKFESTETITRAVTLEFSRHYPETHSARTILERMFRNVSSDIAAMNGAFAAQSVYDWFPGLYGSSVSGISEDYEFALVQSPALLPVKVPSLFVHGDVDPLTPLKRIEAVRTAWRDASMHVIERAGHFASASHAETVWGALGGFVKRN